MPAPSAPTRSAFWVDPDKDPRNTDEPPVGEVTTLRECVDGRTRQ